MTEFGAFGAGQPELAARGLRFDAAIPHNGYHWWYIDAFSEDGLAGLTIIAFVGSVFSPYYARARQRGPADPEDFSSLNVILYGPDRKRWALTERGRGELQRSRDVFRVGPSAIIRQGSRLVIDVNEWCVPLPTRLRGQITVQMQSLGARCFALDAPGQHRWWPISPVADVSVDMTSPGLSWRGRGYVDCNAGVVPLEQTFRGWHWLRAESAHGGEIHYDTRPREGEGRSITVEHDASGRFTTTQEQPLLAQSHVASTPVWRIHRSIRAGSGFAQASTLEDTPFYARSKVTRDEQGSAESAMHESLDLDRFRQAWVRTLLPFRMPRRAGW